MKTTLGLLFLPPGHASKIHVHTVDNDGDPDDAARPANKQRGSPSDFVRTLNVLLSDPSRDGARMLHVLSATTVLNGL